MTKKVNENNTKKEILEAYHAVTERLKEAENQKLDPLKEQKNKTTLQTLSQAAETASASVEDQIASLQKNVAGILGNLSNSFSEEIKKYNTLREAIKLKEEELKELIDIEKEAFTLAGLVNTRKEMSAKFDADHAQKQEEYTAALNEIVQEMNQLKLDTQAEINKMKEAARLERVREQEEYHYNFKRKKQQDFDTLNDELEEVRKNATQNIDAQYAKLAADQKDILEREKAVETREEKMEELEAKVAEFPIREAEIRAEVEEKVRKEEAKTAAIKENYAKKQAENEKLVSDAEIKLLKESLQEEKNKNAALAEKLDKAYEKIQGMALASVNGSNESKAFEKIAGMINDKK